MKNFYHCEECGNMIAGPKNLSSEIKCSECGGNLVPGKADKRQPTEPTLFADIGKDADSDKYCIKVTGDTYPHREEFKAAGYRWNDRYGRWQFDFDGTPTADDAQAALDRLQPLADYFSEHALEVRPA